MDRKKDMILVSGFNVYPNEVEEAVAMHPGCATWRPLASPTTVRRGGQGFVVRKDTNLTAEALIEHCRREPDRLQRCRARWNSARTRHAPMSAKILRRALKEGAEGRWPSRDPAPGTGLAGDRRAPCSSSPRRNWSSPSARRG